MRGSGMYGGEVIKTLIFLVIVTTVGVVGLQIAGFDYQNPHETEHYNKSIEWCNQENGTLYLANDAAQAEHNGFHCTTDDGTTYHMHRVADLNYIHDIDTVKSKCGTTHQNTPLVVGCNWPLWTVMIGVLVVVIGAYMTIGPRPGP